MFSVNFVKSFLQHTVSNISNSRSVYRHISIYKNVSVSPILFFMCQYVKRYRYSHFFQQHLRRHLFFQGLKVIFLSASVWRWNTLNQRWKLVQSFKIKTNLNLGFPVRTVLDPALEKGVWCLSNCHIVASSNACY